MAAVKAPRERPQPTKNLGEVVPRDLVPYDRGPPWARRGRVQVDPGHAAADTLKPSNDRGVGRALLWQTPRNFCAPGGLGLQSGALVALWTLPPVRFGTLLCAPRSSQSGPSISNSVWTSSRHRAIRQRGGDDDYWRSMWRSISAREWVDGEACPGGQILGRFDGGPFVRRLAWTDIVVDASTSDHPGFAHTYDA